MQNVRLSQSSAIANAIRKTICSTVMCSTNIHILCDLRRISWCLEISIKCFLFSMAYDLLFETNNISIVHIHCPLQRRGNIRYRSDIGAFRYRRRSIGTWIARCALWGGGTVNGQISSLAQINCVVPEYKINTQYTGHTIYMIGVCLNSRLIRYGPFT